MHYYFTNWSTNAFMLWRIFVENFSLIGPPTVLLKPLKIDLLMGNYFFLIFLFHTLAWACVFHLKFQSLLVSFISQLLLNRFQYNLYYCLLYGCSTSTTIFRLIWLLKVTPEYTLHGIVKDSITQNSIVIFSLNFKEKLIC